jgi:hypothetical protein
MKEDSHIARTILISTKPNQENWQISKKTGHEKVKFLFYLWNEIPFLGFLTSFLIRLNIPAIS